jgi:hypothetical protein
MERARALRFIPPLKGEGAERSEAGGVYEARNFTPHPARYARHPPPSGEGLGVCG